MKPIPLVIAAALLAVGLWAGYNAVFYGVDDRQTEQLAALIAIGTGPEGQKYAGKLREDIAKRRRNRALYGVTGIACLVAGGLLLYRALHTGPHKPDAQTES